MQFQATFQRGDKKLKVSGNVDQLANGQWHGIFTWLMKDAPAILLEPAELVLDTGQVWQIKVKSATSRHTLTPTSDLGSAEFRVLKGLP